MAEREKTSFYRIFHNVIIYFLCHLFIYQKLDFFFQIIFKCIRVYIS